MATYEVTTEDGAVYQIDTAEPDIQPSRMDQAKNIGMEALGSLTSVINPLGPLAVKAGRYVAQNPKQAVLQAADYMPAAGGIALPVLAGLVSGGMSIPASAALSGLGMAGGEGYKQVIRRSLGEEPAPPIPNPVPFTKGNLPRIPMVYPEVSNLATQGAIGVATDLIGPVVSKGYKLVKNPIVPVGKTVANTLESASGLVYKNKGALRDVYNDPGLFFAPGKEKAGEAFEVARKANGGTTVYPREMIENQAILNKANELLKEGKLTAPDAHIARQAVDSLAGSKTFSQSQLKNLRKAYDNVVKADKAYKTADKLYKRASTADAVRTLLPVNKGGGTSIMKSSVGALLTPLLPVISPAVQGVGAAGLGVASKAIGPVIKNPKLTSALLKAISRKKLGSDTK